MKMLKSIFLLFLFLPVLTLPQNVIKVGYLVDEKPASLTVEEKCAFEWLKKNFPGAEIVEFDKIENTPQLNKFDLLWWHYDKDTQLPAVVKNKNTVSRLLKYIESGKPLLLTLLAAQYAIDLGIETTPPNVIVKGEWEIKDTYKEIKGFHSFAGHPVFSDLSDGAYTWNTKTKFNYAAAYYADLLPSKGKVAAIGWDYIKFKKEQRHIIEYSAGKGKCLSIGSYIYFSDDKNVYRKHLEKLISNSFDYLMDRKRNERKSYWQFDKLGFELSGAKTANKTTIKKGIVNTAQNSGLEIKRDTAGRSSYIGVSGLRTLMMGKETGGLDEVWVHPLRAFMNYSVSAAVTGKEISLNTLCPQIISRPESFIRNYQLNAGKIVETIYAARNLPSGVINYKINMKNKAKIKISFNVDDRMMWPYDEDFPGKCYISRSVDNSSVTVKSSDGSLVSIFGMDCKCNTEIKILDTKQNTKYAAIEFTVDLKEGDNEINFLFASSNEGMKETSKYYQKTLDNTALLYAQNVDYYKNLFAARTVIESPDKEFNDAYKWALAGVDKFFVYTYPLGSSFMAGFGTTERGWDGEQKISGRPGYAWYFGRDSEWTSFAALDYGDFKKVKTVLEFLGKYQDLTGKIFHELTSSNAVHFDAADSTPLYVILMGKYLEATGDNEFIKKEWSRIKRAMDFCYSTDTDKDGLIENTNVGHGWVEGGKIYGAHVTFYLAGLWASALDYAGKMADDVNNTSLAASYKKDNLKVREIIERDFWNKETKFYNDGKNIDGSFAPLKTIQVAVPMYFNSTDYDKSSQSIKEFMGNDYTANWGSRIIGESNPMFNPRGYHYGTVWPLFTGWVSLAEYKYGYHLQAFPLVMNNLNIYKNWGLGYSEEVLNGSEYKPAGVCSHQAWSESMAIQPLLEGMIDIKPDMTKNKLIISPKIPPHFNELKVKNIRFGKDIIDMDYTFNDGVFSYEFKTKEGTSAKITLVHQLFPGEMVKTVSINGKKIDFSLTDGKEMTIEFDLKKEISVVLETAGGIMVKPVIPDPVLNEKAYGTRILEESYSEGKYLLSLEGIPGSKENITVFTDRVIKKTNGAVLTSGKGNIKIIEVKFPQSQKNYVPLRVELEF